MSTFRELSGLAGLETRNPMLQVLAECIADATGSRDPRWIQGVIDDSKFLVRLQLAHDEQNNAAAARPLHVRRRRTRRAGC